MSKHKETPEDIQKRLQRLDDEALARRSEESTSSGSYSRNHELLKQAIEDAKAVRLIALANAKEALEKAFQNAGHLV
jgi:hypothetical protein